MKAVKKPVQKKSISIILAKEQEWLGRTREEREELVDSLMAVVPSSLKFFFQQRRAGIEEIAKNGHSTTYLFLGDFPYNPIKPVSLEEAKEILESLKKAWKGIISVDVIERGTKGYEYFELFFKAE